MTPIKKGDNRGTSLAEMIITFALVGIFMAAVVSVISSAIVIHSELTNSMYAQNVGEMLLDKVTGELAAASADHDKMLWIGDAKEIGGTQGSGAVFYDRDGKITLCMVQDRHLVFEYDNADMMQTGTWELADKAYMGYDISDFQISKINEKNILEIKIKIKNKKSGFEYMVSRCTQCYNFASEDDFKKITQGESCPLQINEMNRFS